MIFIQLPVEIIQLISKLHVQQPTIWKRAAPYMEAAFIQGNPADQLELIKILNENLGVLVLPEFTIAESALIWLAGLARIPPELGSQANPHPIILH